VTRLSPCRMNSDQPACDDSFCRTPYRRAEAAQVNAMASGSQHSTAPMACSVGEEPARGGNRCRCAGGSPFQPNTPAFSVAQLLGGTPLAPDLPRIPYLPKGAKAAGNDAQPLCRSTDYPNLTPRVVPTLNATRQRRAVLTASAARGQQDCRRRVGMMTTCRRLEPRTTAQTCHRTPSQKASWLETNWDSA
jgi:hypothetical protein